MAVNIVRFLFLESFLCKVMSFGNIPIFSVGWDGMLYQHQPNH